MSIVLSEQVLSELDESIQTCAAELAEIRFNKQDFRHKIVVGLALSTVERAHAVAHLIKLEKAFDAEIIFRSMLEHLVDLKNCLDDVEYHKHFLLPFHKGMRRTLEGAKLGNPFFQSISKEIDLETELDIVRERVDTLKARGSKDLSAIEKFRRAGFESEYEAMFRSTSSQVHPSFSGIIKRHFEIEPNTDDFKVCLFARPASTTVEALLHSTGETLNAISELMSKFHKELQDES